MRHASARGAVLILVTWVLALIAVAALGVSRNTRTAVDLAAVDSRIARAHAAAEAGIWRGLYEILEPLDAAPWRSDGTAYEIRVGQAEVRVAMQDQGGLVDINTAQPEVLRNLLAAAADPAVDIAAVTDAIMDWRDADSLRRPFGAEDAEYERAGYAWGAKDGLFNAKEELQQVDGISHGTYAAIASYITVHGQSRRINVQSAPAFVLAIVPGLEAAAAQAILDARGGPAEVPADAAQTDPVAAITRVSTSGVVEIRAAATIAGVTQRVSAVVLIDRKMGGGYELLAWREGYDVAAEIEGMGDTGT